MLVERGSNVRSSQNTTRKRKKSKRLIGEYYFSSKQNLFSQNEFKKRGIYMVPTKFGIGMGEKPFLNQVVIF